VDVLTDPVAWWIEPFADNPFMRSALLAGLLAVLCTSVVGTWVVLRGMAFLGDALAHGVLPGIAIAFVLGWSTTVGALVAALAMVVGVNLLRTRSRLPADASIGVLFVGFLALAVVVMSAAGGAYAGDLNRFLFGSVTGIGESELARQAVAAAVTLVAVAVLHRALLLATFDEAQAELAGFRPRWANMALLALVAVAIVASFEVVGNLLVFAFLVAPPAAATLVARRVPWIMLTAVAMGAASVVIGLLVSYHHDTAAGATMALASVAGYLLALLVDGVRRAARREARSVTA
jgi:ABC-type Mn2+/Zn2+ transport system permease subunit